MKKLMYLFMSLIFHKQIKLYSLDLSFILLLLASVQIERVELD